MKKILILVVVLVAVVLAIALVPGLIRGTAKTSVESTVVGAGTTTTTVVPLQPITVDGFWGGEKTALLTKDPEVQRILQDTYKLTVKGSAMGSIDLVEGDVAGKDFLWPGSRTALEIFKARGLHYDGETVLLRSPIVIYAWDEGEKVTQALIKAGLVQKVSNLYYAVDTALLTKEIAGGRQWSALGVDYYGKVKVNSTDPKSSNSGLLFFGLMANALKGDVVTLADLQDPSTNIMAALRTIYNDQGNMEKGSEKLFQAFLQTGAGTYPMIALYESELQEYAVSHPEQLTTLRSDFRILYPSPTVWSEHVLIALTPGGTRLAEALSDPDIQRIAWEKHGFRTGLAGGTATDVSAFQLLNIPKTIDKVTPVPRPDAMTYMKDNL